jgi:ribosome-interacting GTPase 1
VPANLSLEAQIAWAEYQDAKSLDERIAKLENFLSKVNKHKGNENLIAVNKTKLSKLKEERDEIEQRKKTLTARKDDAFAVKKEHQTPQVLLISDFFDLDQGGGVGKSTILRNMTGVTDLFPGIFTAEPVIGVYTWQKVKFQFVEVPALHEATYLNRAINLVRTTDIVALLIDLSRDPLKQMQNILGLLENANIYLNRKPPNIKIEKVGAGNVQIFYLSKAAEAAQEYAEVIKEMARAAGMSNAVIKIYEKANLNDLEIAFNRGSVFPKAIIIGTKADLPGSKQNFQLLKATYSNDIPEKQDGKSYFDIYPVAIKVDDQGQEKRTGLEDLGEVFMKKLDFIRIFTKSKKGVAERPLILPRGSTIGDVAHKIHKDMYETFKFAFIYRETGPQKKIRAGLNFPVEEFDVIEIFSAL